MNNFKNTQVSIDCEVNGNGAKVSIEYEDDIPAEQKLLILFSAVRDFAVKTDKDISEICIIFETIENLDLVETRKG